MIVTFVKGEKINLVVNIKDTFLPIIPIPVAKTVSSDQEKRLQEVLMGLE